MQLLFKILLCGFYNQVHQVFRHHNLSDDLHPLKFCSHFWMCLCHLQDRFLTCVCWTLDDCDWSFGSGNLHGNIHRLTNQGFFIPLCNQSAYVRLSEFPSFPQSSSAICGAYGAKIRTNADTSSLGGILLLHAFTNSIIFEMGVLNFKPSIPSVVSLMAT